MPVILKKSNHINNVGFISTRIAGMDGVSLEIAKWADVLERNGYNCFYFAGEIDRDPGRCYLCEPAHFEHPDISAMNKSLFGITKRSPDLTGKIIRIKNHVKQCLYEFQRTYNLDLIVPENALTIPMNIPLGIAITEFIAEQAIPAIAHHHDFYWERDRFQINACQDYIRYAFPPDLSCIQHVVINSLASRQLSHRLGISNTVIPNVYDFANPPAPSGRKSELRKQIGLGENDLFVLQPTRVVPRKCIERALEIVEGLDLPNPTLVISHALGDEGDDYFQRIREYADALGVHIAAVEELIVPPGVAVDREDRYTISDLYQSADIITYPSGYEGFGNAFLETIYYKKPIIVNRYSIFIADIEPRGFDVLVFDGLVTGSAISRIRELLEDKKRKEEMTEKNYELARKYFSYEILEEKLMHLMHAVSGV